MHNIAKTAAAVIISAGLALAPLAAHADELAPTTEEVAPSPVIEQPVIEPTPSPTPEPVAVEPSAPSSSPSPVSDSSTSSAPPIEATPSVPTSPVGSSPSTPAETPAPRTEQPTVTYVTAAWYALGTEQWPAEGQTLSGHVQQSAKVLDVAYVKAQAEALGCGYTIQGDLYVKDKTTGKLLEGGKLYGPSNPTESWPDGQYRGEYSIVFYTGDCPVIVPPVAINPNPPTFDDFCGTENDATSIPTDTAEVTYTGISGEFEGRVTSSVTATAAEGYVLNLEGATTLTWEFEFTNEACPVEVPPTEEPPVTEPPVVVPPVVEPPVVVTPITPAAAVTTPEALAFTGTDEAHTAGLGFAGAAMLLIGGLALYIVRRGSREVTE